MTANTTSTALQTIPPPYQLHLPLVDPSETLPVLLTKLAFSSGLSRSTKLAHLESLLSTYLQSIYPIPTHLASPPRFPFLLLSLFRETGARTPYTYTRSFILRKTGELLLLRAQLNLYSELTDPLPDLFWDTKHELGLERAYEEVGRALDVERRIDVANERMGYASDVVGTLRGALSERHGLVLEWMIIVLIAVEVGFEVNRLWKEREERKKVEKTRGEKEGVTEKEKEGRQEVGKGVLAVEMLAPNAAQIAGVSRAEESGEVDVDNVRRELEEMVERQRKLLNALEVIDKRKMVQTMSSTPASSPQSSPSSEPVSPLTEQPIQALLATE